MRQRRFTLASMCLALSWFWLFGAAGLPITTAQDPPLYTYDVLPGIQPGGASTTGTYEAADVALTQGWHYTRENAIDIGSSPADTPVYAAIRAIEPDSLVTATVRWSANRNGCKYVSVTFVRTTADSQELLGEVRYLHTSESSDLQDGQAVPLPTTADAVAVTQIGSLVHAPWIRVRARGDDWSSKIAAEIDRRLTDGVSNPLDKSSGLGNVQTVTVDGKSFRVRQMFGEWYEQSWRATLDESEPRFSDGTPATDGPECASTGPHLHQAELIVAGNSLWRNIDDRFGNLDGGGGGRWGLGQTVSGMPCSDVFRT